MAKAGPKTKPCSATTRRGRLNKAKQFWDAAGILDDLVSDEEEDLVDAYITLCIHAGIAAADVICCARLGKHAQGQSHEEAIALLDSVDPAAARHLATLLRMKTRIGYGDMPGTTADRTKAKRAAGALITAAEKV